MRNYIPVSFCVVAFVLLFGIFGNAQPSQSFNYQAALRNAEGQALSSQPVVLKISLTDQGATSTYYVESHQTSTNAQGIVNLSVGSGTVLSGQFSLVPWGTEQIFLKVEMESAGGSFVDMGTSPIKSVPFALFAADGNQGPQGEPGPQGEQGIQGIPGQQGEQIGRAHV